MIVERCTKLEAQFSAAHHTYQLETRLSRVQQEADRVKALRRQSEASAAILTTLSSRATDPVAKAGIEEAARVAHLHPQLASLWERLKSDEDLLGGREFEAYKEAFHATANICNRLRSAAERTWRDHASSYVQNDHPILDVFEGSNAKAVADLRRLGRQFLVLRNVSSPSRAQIEQFDRKVAEYRAAFGRLGGDIPKDVRQALQAAAPVGGAPIDLFSPDVMAWLRERGLTGSFRVIAKSAS